MHILCWQNFKFGHRMEWEDEFGLFRMCFVLFCLGKTKMYILVVTHNASFGQSIYFIDGRSPSRHKQSFFIDFSDASLKHFVPRNFLKH